jgi:hypothetical protein
MTTTTETTFNIKDRVKITGENGFYWVYGNSQDGSVTLWGGDKDPNGYRSFRSVKPERLTLDTRTLNKKAFPSFVFEQNE